MTIRFWAILLSREGFENKTNASNFEAFSYLLLSLAGLENRNITFGEESDFEVSEIRELLDD